MFTTLAGEKFILVALVNLGVVTVVIGAVVFLYQKKASLGCLTSCVILIGVLIAALFIKELDIISTEGLFFGTLMLMPIFIGVLLIIRNQLSSQVYI